MRKNYYLILRLRPEASPDQIRSAYRRRALELHPDLTGSGSDQFLELQEAYDVLSDPVRRELYDREGEEIPIRRLDATRSRETIVPRKRRAEPLVTPRQAREFEDIALFRSFETFSPSLDELFERLYGNFSLRTRPKAECLESLNVEIPLSPQQAFAGGEVRVMVPARVVCDACLGHGRIGPYECAYCEGQGEMTAEYPVTVSYPAVLGGDYIVQVPLERFGIRNFYLTVQFRPTAAAW
ncbi:MAG TPA: DnaJ domain-containing protein [Chthoniobacterales bacterium]|jgi:DnaJ-class molecular chaperone|nr:DnaJ domain-containing protein [Chthoniobacterales bacterium]